MKKGFLKSILFVITLAMSASLFAQCDTIANSCAKHLASAHFISDGQEYRSLLASSEEIAEFHTTFYGGTLYRIAACSGLTDGNLIFSVFDNERNLLFTNSDYKNAPYWDFKIVSTLDCIIEARINSQKRESGCAVILIGFKQ